MLRETQGEASPAGAGAKPRAAADARNFATLPAPAAELRPAAAQGRYETILDANALAEWLARLTRAELVCVDTETTSLDPLTARLVGLSICCEPLVAAYLPLA